jgi:hypothetical protein
MKKLLAFAVLIAAGCIAVNLVTRTTHIRIQARIEIATPSGIRTDNRVMPGRCLFAPVGSGKY